MQAGGASERVNKEAGEPPQPGQAQVGTEPGGAAPGQQLPPPLQPSQQQQQLPNLWEEDDELLTAINDLEVGCCCCCSQRCMLRVGSKRAWQASGLRSWCLPFLNASGCFGFRSTWGRAGGAPQCHPERESSCRWRGRLWSHCGHHPCATCPGTRRLCKRCAGSYPRSCCASQKQASGGPVCCAPRFEDPSSRAAGGEGAAAGAARAVQGRIHTAATAVRYGECRNAVLVLWVPFAQSHVSTVCVPQMCRSCGPVSMGSRELWNGCTGGRHLHVPGSLPSSRRSRSISCCSSRQP